MLQLLNWTQAPFVASYRNFSVDSDCVWSSDSSSCTSVSSSSSTSDQWMSQDLNTINQKRLKWVQDNYMVYNYCTDFRRFPQGLPPECTPSPSAT
uniref:Xyloglucan endo-transglycosylase C-terminal domain-containing protein n=1 Tax=Cucumis sativus TaxID=3659 RepID=A0A0A0LU34_CUCSA